MRRQQNQSYRHIIRFQFCAGLFVEPSVGVKLVGVGSPDGFVSHHGALSVSFALLSARIGPHSSRSEKDEKEPTKDESTMPSPQGKSSPQPSSPPPPPAEATQSQAAQTAVMTP